MAKYGKSISAQSVREDEPTEELESRYREYISETLPYRLNIALFTNNIAWAMQAKNGGLNPATLRQELITSILEMPKSSEPELKAGTKLIREWDSEVHEVTVLQKGFRWRGNTYTSLSPIAREITGTRWSGPRFFGLKPSSS